jgi:CheY-like chemotaxis protein
LRVLVAGDNPAAQRIIDALLTAMGHSVTIVDNGAPAVAEVASGRYDVVIMDVMMPGMDGPTASRRIRELGGRTGGIPIIALTADVMFGRDGRHLLAGMTDYLSKPIDLSVLAAALKRATAHAPETADAS